MFHSKQEVSEAVGRLTGLGGGRLIVGKKRLGIEITLAVDNDAAASRLFCAAPSRGNG